MASNKESNNLPEKFYYFWELENVPLSHHGRDTPVRREPVTLYRWPQGRCMERSMLHLSRWIRQRKPSASMRTTNPGKSTHEELGPEMTLFLLSAH